MLGNIEEIKERKRREREKDRICKILMGYL